MATCENYMKKYSNNIPHNGFFLVFCESLARYDKVLELHLAALEAAQASHRRMQVLSKDTQNEFIECCESAVLRSLLKEVADPCTMQ